MFYYNDLKVLKLEIKMNKYQIQKKSSNCMCIGGTRVIIVHNQKKLYNAKRVVIVLCFTLNMQWHYCVSKTMAIFEN